VNRFTLQMDSAAAVEEAHREFSINGAAAGITELGRLDTIVGKTSFIFSDPDSKRWELNANETQTRTANHCVYRSSARVVDRLGPHRTGPDAIL
jgi:hypothetical protein